MLSCLGNFAELGYEDLEFVHVAVGQFQESRLFSLVFFLLRSSCSRRVSRPLNVCICLGVAISANRTDLVYNLTLFDMS